MRNPFDSAAADSFLQNYKSSFDFPKTPPPSTANFQQFLFRARHSGPGIDSLPYAAWKFAGVFAYQLLFEASLWLRSGRTMCIDFNDALHHFAAKGDEDLDHSEVLRSPSDTRPLGLRNTDNKTIAACANWSMKKTISVGASRLQNGFIFHRNFLNNIVNLDAAARVYSMDTSKLLPIIALFDFGAAFPSVLHQWLWRVLRAVGLPLGAIDLGWSLYWFVMWFGKINNAVTHFLFMIFSGVLQGCPLSGSFFVFAIDPFLQAFDLAVVQPGKGVIGACADDIGASLASIQTLVDMFKIFDVARVVAGLSLKVQKCVIVPISASFSEELCETIRSWLAMNLPLWSDFAISEAGKYLGAFLGPAASQKLWTNAANKWASRSYSIGNGAMPLQLSVMLYNSRAVTTLGYISPFALLPDKLIRQERYILSKLLHLPPNSFKTGDYFNLVYLGFRHIRSLLALAAASMIRAALETITVWKECLPWLESSASDMLPGSRWAKKGMVAVFLGYSGDCIAT